MKNFTKVLSAVLSAILFVNTFSIGAFAAVRATPALEFTERNVRITSFSVTDINQVPKPNVVYDKFNDDGTLSATISLIEGIHYSIKYLRFQSDSSVNIQINAMGNSYTGRVELAATFVQENPMVGFYAYTDRDTGVGETPARSYTFLDTVHFSVNVPEIAGKLSFYYEGNQFGSTIDVTSKRVQFSYDTNTAAIKAGIVNDAVTVKWEKSPTETFYFVIAGFNLKKLNLTALTANDFEPIPRKEVDGTAYEPKIFLKDRKSSGEELQKNTSCVITYVNNVNETSQTYKTKAIIKGQQNFEGEATLYYELFVPGSVIPSEIVVDRSDKLYTYGDEILLTAYVRSGAGSNNTASFWVERDEVSADILLGTAKVDYIGRNGTAILKYQTSGKELKIFDGVTSSTKNVIKVSFDSGDAASVDGVMMLPKPVELIVHCKDQVYNPATEWAASIPVGPGVKNYTFVGRLLLDDIRIADADIGTARFGTTWSNTDKTAYYAGKAKPTIASGFTMTGAHKAFYTPPTYAYGTANISKLFDPKMTVSPVLSTYVISSDEGKFVLDGENKIVLTPFSGDTNIGDLSFKVANVIDIDRGGIFEKKPTAVGNALEYKAKDADVEAPPQKATALLIISSTNYTDVQTNVSFELVKKKWAKIDGYSVASKVYDGLPAVLQGKAIITSEDNNLLVSSKELVFNYISADGGSYTASEPPILPGKYYAVITLPKTAYGYYAKTSIPFTIEKATITVSTPSFEIYQGQEKLPDVPISFTGFVNKETAAVFTTNTLAAAHSTPDTLLAGKFAIGFTGEITSDKYDFVYAPGLLTIIKIAKYPALDPIPEKVNDISVYLPKASYPDKILSFEELALSINVVVPSDDRLITQVMQQKSGFKNYKKMDIKLIEVLTGNAVQPKGKVTISIPYPAGSDSTMNFKVLHLYKNSTKLEMITPTKVVGGLQFQVSEFSAFVIGWEKALATEDTEFFITNAQIKTEKKQFNVTVREDARKASYALTKFFEESTKEKAVVFNNPDVIITFDKNALAIKEVMASYDFYATKNSCEHETAARELGGEGFVAMVHFNHQGYWPGLAKVSINIGEDKKGEELAYYFYNPVTATLDYVTKATVDKDGWFTVDQDHCSDYVVSSEFPVAIPSPTPSPTPEPTPAPEPIEKTSFLTNIWNFIKGIPAFVMALPGNIKNFITNASATFSNIAKTMSNIFKNVAGFFSKVTSPVAKVFSGVGTAVGGVVDKVKAGVSGIMKKVTDTIDNVKEAVGNGVTGVKENPFLFIGLLIVIALVALIVFFVMKLLNKRKAAKAPESADDDSDDNTSDDSDTDDDAQESPKVASPPKTAAEKDDDIEY